MAPRPRRRISAARRPEHSPQTRITLATVLSSRMMVTICPASRAARSSDRCALASPNAISRITASRLKPNLNCVGAADDMTAFAQAISDAAQATARPPNRCRQILRVTNGSMLPLSLEQLSASASPRKTRLAGLAWATRRVGWRCTTLTVEDSQCKSRRLDGCDEQAIIRPLPHDEMVQLYCFASQARIASDLAGQGHDLARAA